MSLFDVNDSSEIINKKNTFSHTLISFDAMNEIRMKKIIVKIVEVAFICFI